MGEKIMPPVHPGELLREEFLEPMGITAYQLAIVAISFSLLADSLCGLLHHREHRGTPLREPHCQNYLILRKGGA